MHCRSVEGYDANSVRAALLRARQRRTFDPELSNRSAVPNLLSPVKGNRPRASSFDPREAGGTFTRASSFASTFPEVPMLHRHRIRMTAAVASLALLASLTPHALDAQGTAAAAQARFVGNWEG